MADPRFSPVMNASSIQPDQKKNAFPLLPVLLLLVYGLYAGVMLIGPVYSTKLGNSLDGIMDITARLAIGGVLLVLFAIIMIFDLSRDDGSETKRKNLATRNRRQLNTPQGQTRQFKPAGQTQPTSNPAQKKEIESRSSGPKEVSKPSIIPYPKDVDGGIYGDTYIDLSGSKTLRIRSLVVEPDYLN